MRNVAPTTSVSLPGRALLVLLALLTFPAAVSAQPTCDAPPLSDAQVKEAIDRARAARTDIPAPFAETRWSVKKRGCYYVYVEFQVPEAPDAIHMITLNRHGVVVDVRARGRSGNMECPERVFSDAELAELIRREREERSDLPPPFDDYRAQVARLRCLYLYFEHRIPERRGDYQVFTIDPFGGLMEFSRSEPY